MKPSRRSQVVHQMPNISPAKRSQGRPECFDNPQFETRRIFSLHPEEYLIGIAGHAHRAIGELRRKLCSVPPHGKLRKHLL